MSETVSEKENLKIKEIARLCAINWKWFVLSLVICLGCATIYLLRTPPVYARTASVLIKQQGTGSSFASEISSFADMGTFSSAMDVDNEIITIQSPALVAETVRRLGLDVSYSKKGRFHNETLYGTTLPVTVAVSGLDDNDACSFRLEIDKKGKINISNLKYKKKKYDRNFTGSLNKPIKTPGGTFTVTPTAAYTPGEEIDINVSRSGIIAATQAYQSKFKSQKEEQNTSIIKLTFRDLSIQRAEDFLNTLLAVYNESWIEDRNKIAIASSRFIDDRLRVIEQELGNVDNDIAGYKSQNLLPDVDAVSQLYMGQASTANAQILELNNQLSMARYLRNFIADQGPRNQLLPANSGINNSGIERQIEEYNKQLLQRNNMVSTSSTSNPLVMDMDKGLASMRGAIMSSIDNQISSLTTQIAGFRGSEAKSNSHIASNPTQAKYLQSVERQQKVKESLYLFLLQKREENELSQAFSADNNRVITPPTGSLSPVAPSNVKVLCVAFLFGLLIPAGCIVVIENSNTKVRDRNDVENMAVPFIGEIPEHKPEKYKLPKLNFNNKNRETTQLVVKPHCRDIINDAFRVICTNLNFIIDDTPGNKVIACTSMYPNSGKTFVSMNLAAVYAIQNKKICIIDMDLRKASLSDYVHRPHKGISKYLSGQIEDWHDIVIHDAADIKGLDFIPVGSLPPNPTELIIKSRLKEFIKQVRDEYEITIIDCAPAEIVADTAILTKLSDQTLFIVRAGLMDRSVLPAVDNFYTEHKFGNLSMILNGVSSYRGHYGYGYGYIDKKYAK